MNERKTNVIFATLSLLLAITAVIAGFISFGNGRYAFVTIDFIVAYYNLYNFIKYSKKLKKGRRK